MNKDLKYRYPGPTPFDDNQHDIFFGREDDMKRLYRKVKFEDSTVLHGKSGIGKSSLINASFIKQVQKDEKYLPIKVRLFAHDKKNENLSPTERTGNAIRKGKDRNSVRTFLDNLIENEDSLWHDVKEFQIKTKNSKGLLLIFDQFEELFSYPFSERHNFEKQLSEALYTKVPQRYWDILEELADQGNNPLTKEQVDIFHQKPLVKVLFVIRFDKLYLLSKQFNEYLPDVLSNPFELGDLTVQSAKLAITKPAMIKEANFQCPPFEYADSSLDQIIDFLTLNGKSPIDTTHLQIVCQAIEYKQIERVFSPLIKNIDPEELKKIIDDYYEDKIRSLGDSKIQEVCRRLIEDQLIYAPEKRRLSLFSGVILQYLTENGISDPENILSKLKDSRLIREEPKEGGIYYELSHDRLIDTILESKKSYDVKQRQLKETEYLEDLQKERKQKANWRKLAISAISLGVLVGLLFLNVLILNDKLTDNEQRIKENEDLIKEKEGKINELLATSEVHLNQLFTDVESKINKLDYEGAVSNLLFATNISKFDTTKLQAPPKELFLELSYYYNEIGVVDTAKMILKEFPLDNNIITDSTDYTYTDIAKIIKELAGSSSFEIIKDRYYPDMVLIQGDTFIMGLDSALLTKHQNLVASNRAIRISRSDSLNKIPRPVYLNSFSISKSEITIRQYHLFKKSKNSTIPSINRYYNGTIPSGELPISEVTWKDAFDYSNWLNKKYGYPELKRNYRNNRTTAWIGSYRLPTAAEWEFAAKEGIYHNNVDPYIFSGSDNYEEVGFLRDKDEDDAEYIFPKQVMSLRPNKLGVFDLTGNVLEWCYDTYGIYDTTTLLLINPVIINRYERRGILKGGSARTDFRRYTNTYQKFKNQTHTEEIYGFRIVRGAGN